MEVKRYLNRAYRAEKLIKSNKKELEQIYEIAYSLKSPSIVGFTGNNTGASDAGYTKAIEKATDLEKLILKDIQKLYDIQIQIRDLINGVEDPDEKLLLRLRYINFFKWEDIAEEMNFSDKQVFRIHTDALKKIEKKLTVNDSKCP